MQALGSVLHDVTDQGVRVTFAIFAYVWAMTVKAPSL